MNGETDAPMDAACQPPRDHGLVILVVEDEPLVGDVLAELLRLAGHTVDQTVNGREALERIHKRVYDLIVSDVLMPDLDGPALYRELRRLPGAVPCLLLVTGDAMSPDTRDFLDRTRLPWLEKPFGAVELEAAVRRALASST
jgi:two-component system NtrC family sensor kinase